VERTFKKELTGKSPLRGEGPHCSVEEDDVIFVLYKRNLILYSKVFSY